LETGRTPVALLRVFDRIGAAVTTAPLATLGVIAVLTAGLSWSAMSLRVDNDHRNFFIQNDPLLASQDRFERLFGSDDFVMVYVEGNLFTPEAFAAIDRLYGGMTELTYQDKPAFNGVLTPFHAQVLVNDGGAVRARPVLESLTSPTRDQLRDARERLIQHPVYRNLIIDPRGRSAAVIGPIRNVDGNPELYDIFLDTQMQRLMDDPELEKLGALLVGGPIFRQRINGATMSEAALFGFAAIVVSLISLYGLFRRKRQVLAAVLVVAVAVAWTIGLMAAADVPMSLFSIILPLLIIVTGLGSCVHLVNAFSQFGAAGMTRRQAAHEAVRVMGTPCMLTGLTTAIGFFTVMTAPVEPMRELGFFAGTGIVLAFVLSVLIVPAVLVLGDGDAKMPRRDVERQERSDALFGRLASFVVQNKRAVTLTMLIAAIVAAAGAQHLRVETHFLHSLRSDFPFRQAVEHVDERLGGSNAVELMIDTYTPGGVYDPAVLRAVDELEAYLVEEHGRFVGVTLSAVGLFKELNHAFVGKRALPDSREGAAQLLLLYEQGGLDTRLGMDHERRVARVSIRTRAMTSAESLALEQAIRAKAETLFADVRVAPRATAPNEQPDTPPIVLDDDDDDEIVIVDEEDEADPEIVVDDDAAATRDGGAREGGGEGADEAEPRRPTLEVAGTAQLFVHLNNYVIRSQARSFSLAAVIIALVMILMLRSARLGLAIMIPNLLPIAATYGLLGWAGVRMDFLTAIVGVAALGVAVDGTIHIGTKYRRSREGGRDAEGAAHDVMTGIGRALVVTSGVLTLGFASVSPSIISALARFGLSMALCLLLAMVYDLIMTPAVLAWLSPDAPKRRGGSSSS
jgi:predicted RND superfamily exporter protein